MSEPQGDAAHGRDASSPGGIIAGVIVAVLATVVIEVVPVAVVAKVVVGRPSRVRRVRQQGGEEGRVWQKRPMH